MKHSQFNNLLYITYEYHKPVTIRQQTFDTTNAKYKTERMNMVKVKVQKPISAQRRKQWQRGK